MDVAVADEFCPLFGVAVNVKDGNSVNTDGFVGVATGVDVVPTGGVFVAGVSILPVDGCGVEVGVWVAIPATVVPMRVAVGAGVVASAVSALSVGVRVAVLDELL